MLSEVTVMNTNALPTHAPSVASTQLGTFQYFQNIIKCIALIA